MIEILLEITMDKALKLLDIDKIDARDAAKLKAAYKNASLKNHPDRGGNNDAMQQVNAAYELLSKYAGTPASSGSTSGKFDWEKSRREYIELGLKILELLRSEFKIQNFISHFSKIYERLFQYKIIREWPKESDRDSYYAGMDVEFFDESRDIVFKLNFSCYLTDVKYNKSLGGGYGNISYPLGVSAFGFFNNKKLKITKRDYQRTQNHDVLSNPEISFPVKRLETFKMTSSSKQFRREDMILTLKNKIQGGEWYDNQFSILLGKSPRVNLVFQRATFQRQPYWAVNCYVNLKYQKVDFVYLPETEETAKFLIDLAADAKKQNPDHIISFLNREISKYKSAKGQ